MTTLAEVEIIVTTLPQIYKDAAKLIRENGLAKYCMFVSKRTERGRNSLGPADDISDYRICTYAALEYAADQYDYYMTAEDFKPLIDAMGYEDSQIFYHNRNIYSMLICQFNNKIDTNAETIIEKLEQVYRQLNMVNFVDTADNVLC